MRTSRGYVLVLFAVAAHSCCARGIAHDGDGDSPRTAIPGPSLSESECPVVARGWRQSAGEAVVVNGEDDRRAYLMYNEGVQFEESGEMRRALWAYQQATVLKPDLVHAWNNLGGVFKHIGLINESWQAYGRALEIASLAGNRFMLAGIYNNLGLLHFVQATTGRDPSQIEAAANDPERIRLRSIPLYEKALESSPQHVDAMYNLANARRLLGDVQHAFRLYSCVLRNEPYHTGANLNIGGLLLSRNRFEEAIPFQERATKAARTSTEMMNALNNLGITLREAGYFSRAIEAHKKASGFEEDGVYSRVLGIVAQRSALLWVDYDFLHLRVAPKLCRTLATMTIACDVSPYDSVLFHRPGLVHRPTVAQAHVSQFRMNYKVLDTMKQRRGNYSASQRKLRVAYLSFDMGKHPMGYLTLGLFRHHEKSLFEVSIYSYGFPDGSEQERAIRSAASFHDVSEYPSDRIASSIRENSIDIVVDLMAHTRGSRIDIAAMLPSPVYINYLGFPGTSGFGFPGAFILADRTILPAEMLAARSEVTETPLLLPCTYQSNDYSLGSMFCPLSLGVHFWRKCRETRSSMSRFLHIKQRSFFRFANFNKLDKYEPAAFQVWMNVLRRVPQSVLFLLEPRKENTSSGLGIARNVRQLAKGMGVNPERIIFLPKAARKEHLDRLVGVDLFLDNLHYGAHTTATDTLWAGVPVLTIEGSHFASRVGHSLLHGLGLSQELVAPTLRDMEDVAVLLAQTPERYLAVRKKLAGRLFHASEVFRAASKTRYVELAYSVAFETSMFATSPRPGVIHIQHVPGYQGPFLTTKLIQDSVGTPGYSELRKTNALFRLLESYSERKADPHSSEDSERNLDVLWVLLGTYLRRPSLVSRYASRLIGTRQWELFVEPNGEVSTLRTALWRVLLRAFKNEERRVARTVLNLLLLANTTAPTAPPLRARAWSRIVQLPVRDISWFGEMLSAAFRESQSTAPFDEVLSMRIQAFLLRLEFHRGGSQSEAAEVSRNFQARLQLGAHLTLLHEHELALDTHLSAVRDENRFFFGSAKRTSFKVPRKRGSRQRKRIVIYCHEYGQTWWPNWGPRSPLTAGAGGSEEAVIFVANELAQLGYQVEVYADPLDEDIGWSDDGVLWLPHTWYDLESRPEVFIAWRYHISMALAGSARFRFLWLHDMVTNLAVQIGILLERGVVHNVLTGSRFHSRALGEHPLVLESSRVVGYGLQPEYFHDGPNRRYEFIYASSPNRGLQQLLQIWPYIRERVGSKATLRIYYGFSDSFLAWGRRSNIPNFELWVEKMKTQISSLGSLNVVYEGMVKHHELAKAYANAGFSLYPTSFSETGCVSMMKAMAMGAIPITSRYENSSLPDLTGLWDLGPAAGPLTIDRDPALLQRYADAVVNAVNDPSYNSKTTLHRENMKSWARTELLWSSIAQRLINLTLE